MSFWGEQIGLLLLATTANVLSSLAGGGAGLVQLPVLIFLGLPFATALATHKIATVALGLGASIKHARTGALEWPMALFILGAGLPGVVLGARVVLQLPENLARIALGLLTMGLGLYSIANRSLGQESRALHRNRKGLAVGGLVVLLIGFLNGSLTSGTGLFVTMWLVRWFGFDYKQATAYTLVLVGLFWNGAGALTLTMLTPPQWSWMPALLLGSAIGGYWGAHIAVNKGNTLIKKVFESVTILVGLSLLITTFRNMYVVSIA